jgi:hypothetical protein
MGNSQSKLGHRDLSYSVELEFVFAFHENELLDVLEEGKLITKHCNLERRQKVIRSQVVANHVSAF